MILPLSLRVLADDDAVAGDRVERERVRPLGVVDTQLGLASLVLLKAEQQWRLAVVVCVHGVRARTL